MTELSAHRPVGNGAVLAIRTQAAEWIVQIDGAPTEQERVAHVAACQAWRDADERHDQVFRQMQQMWQSVDASKPRSKAAAVIAAIALALCAYTILPTARWLADEQTALGEVRRVALADGSMLVLDSGTAIDIYMDESKREIRLLSGKILAEVAKDLHGRPFVVSGRDGTARAMGTRYIVDQLVAATNVAVLESSVAVSSLKHPERHVVLQAGDGISFSQEALGQVTSAAPAALEAWTQSRLVFNEAPLPQVIAELSRYRRGILTLKSADTLDELRFTGVVPLDDTDAALLIIAQNLHLKVGQVTPYVVWLEANQ